MREPEKALSAPEPLLRLTTQRQVLLEELARLSSHPTACELYNAVRRRLPRIGLGTVYRNLELMAESGLIVKLETGGEQKRFDAVTAPHYHIRCTACGRVEDMAVEVAGHLVKAAAERTAYSILRHHIEFSGECPQCRQRGLPSAF